MAVVVTNDTILKPSLSITHPNHNIIVPLTVFDQAAFDLHVSLLYAFKPSMPTNQVLKNALSDVLVHYPHLAGRFTKDDEGHSCIVLNDAGVRLIETSVPTTLADQLPFDSSKDLDHLIPTKKGVDELLQIQLNRYTCDGLVIGHTAHHRLADGQSMSSFFVAWARVVRGLGMDLLPYHERASILRPRVQPRVEFDHRVIEFCPNTIQNAPIKLSTFEKVETYFSTEFINKIKASLPPHQSYSSFEWLLAHVWKKVTQARCLDLEEFTQVRVAVNGRGRIEPPPPMEYFGNLVLWAFPRLTVREVLMESHAYVARAIRDAVAKIDDNYFQSFIDFGAIAKRNGEQIEATEPKIGSTLCPNMEVSSWLRFQFHELDFGGGMPCAFYTPKLPVEGLLIFTPTCKEEGGVDVIMSLFSEHVPLFKKICYCLD